MTVSARWRAGARIGRAAALGVLASCAPVARHDAGGGPHLRIVRADRSAGARVELDLDATSRARTRRALRTAEQWQYVFAVWPDTTPSSDRPPMLGRYEPTDRGIAFVPRWPLRPGLDYVAVVDLDALGRAIGAPLERGAPSRITRRFMMPASPALPTGVVAAVYPAADTLPANLLKFYVQFSVPMRQGEAARRVTLLDERGLPTEGSFLRLDDEMWDVEGRRLTLFLDPGRIKRGLLPHRQLGEPLAAGRRYRLHIDASWPDTSGAPLRSGFDKAFVVAPDDRVAPDLGRWRLTVPAAATRDPLVLESPESLDHALAERLVRIQDPAGHRVPVVTSVVASDRVVRLTPRRAWPSGEYRIEIDAGLEDLAGNSFRRLFDVDLEAPGDRPHEALSVVTRVASIR